MSIEESPQPIYSPEAQTEEEHLSLTPEQKEAVRNLTLGTEEVDPRIREMAAEDVIQTLENGHPLNRIIPGKEGETAGFIACQDFTPHEAYIKYFGMAGSSGRNLFREVPAFFEYARQYGYTKLNFNGWNPDLNRALQRFGFERLRTDTSGEFSVDFYEKALTEEKSQEQISQERAQAFEKKYLAKLQQNYEQTLRAVSKENRPKKEQVIAGAYEDLANRLQQTEGFNFGNIQQAVLKLKLARYFQNNDTLDTNVLYDAVIETPKFLGTDKGSFHRLFEVHEQKTIQKIAETRKRRAEMTASEGLNPYEALFTTKSGNYYMARLLNMPHLEEESDYMRHCVGTSDSYINQMKNGDIEILSFRHAPHVDPRSQRLTEDRPIITFEYDLRTNTIQQMKKASDEYLDPSDPYFSDIIDALKKLRGTETDMGKKRDFKKIAESELQNIKVSDFHLLTENGEIHFRDFDPESGEFVLKYGQMPITSETSRSDIAKIARILEGIEVNEEEIAQTEEQISEQTKLYIGSLFPSIFQRYPNLEHIYASTLESRINRSSLEIGGESEQVLRGKLNEVDEQGKRKIDINDFAQDMLDKMFQSEEFQNQQKNPEQIDLVRLKVRDLGFSEGATTDQIYARAQELGLELCPAEVGPHQRLKDLDQPMGEWYRIAMKQIADRNGDPFVFGLERDEFGLWLDGYWSNPTDHWGSDSKVVFRSRK